MKNHLSIYALLAVVLAAWILGCNSTAPSGGSSGMHYKRDTLIAHVGISITPDTLVYKAAASISFIPSPLLPAGLELDGLTGIISGTPSLLVAGANYTVTSFSASGLDSCKIYIKVLSASDTTGTDGSGGGGAGSGVAATGLTQIAWGTYSAQGDVFTQTYYDSVYYCDTAGQVTLDTSYSYFSPRFYALHADSLSIYEYDSLTIGDPFSDTVSVYAAVRYNENYIRVGSGSGIQGTWKYVGDSYASVLGIPNADDKALFDEFVTRSAGLLVYETDEFKLAGDVILYYYDEKSAQEFVDQWNDPLEGGNRTENISVAKVDQYTVRLTGNITHEIVLLAHYSNNEEKISSSNSQHATLWDGPLTKWNCADTSAYSPITWYDDFLTANLKPGTNKSAVLSKRTLINGSNAWRRNGISTFSSHSHHTPF